MGQFPQDKENGQNVAFFHNFWSSAVTKPDEMAPFFQLSVVYHMLFIIRLWRVGLFDFGSGSGRVWPKSSGFGFGFGYCAYCGLKANSLVILCNFISCKGIELMLRKNWNIITTYSSLHQQPCLPSKRTVLFRRKRHPKFRDTLDIDGAIAKCLLCK